MVVDGNRRIGISKPEAVSPEDPPEQDGAQLSSRFPCEWKSRPRLCPGDPRSLTHIKKNKKKKQHNYHSPKSPLGPGTTYPSPHPFHCPPPHLCLPPWPLIAFMPLFSQCEKFDNVHKRNSRIAAGYGKSTCGSSLPPLWTGSRFCSFIDLF